MYGSCVCVCVCVCVHGGDGIVRVVALVACVWWWLCVYGVGGCVFDGGVGCVFVVVVVCVWCWWLCVWCWWLCVFVGDGCKCMKVVCIVTSMCVC